MNKTLFNKIEKYLNVITKHPEHTFWIISLLHYNLSLIILLQIFLFPANHIYFKFGVLFWSLMSVNILFNGNLLIRLEKYLLREKSWEGIYEMLPYCNISKTKENIRKVFHYTSLITYYVILGKIYL